MKTKNEFEEAVLATVTAIRALLASGEEATSNYFEFRVSACGRVHDGDTVITFKLSSAEYSSDAVSGNSIDAVVAEYLRRIGWQKRHDYLALPAA